jgi:hypothetical protein
MVSLGLRDSNTTHTKNSTIKQQNYNLAVKDMKLSVIVFVIIIIIVLLDHIVIDANGLIGLID